jgi:hypothetical protein
MAHHIKHIPAIENTYIIHIDGGLPGGHSSRARSVNLRIIDRHKRQFDQGEWAWFIQCSMGVDQSTTTPTQTLPQYNISTMVILPLGATV